MPQFWESIPQNLQDWALQQQIFFVASAPLAGRHINVSPKGLPAATLTIFDANTVGYLDATGSGVETISHIYENGRATIMFCSFDKLPRVMRWFCTGRVVERDQPGFDGLAAKMGKKGIAGTRAIIVFDVWKVQTACGYAVPMIAPDLDPARIPEGPQVYFKDRQTLDTQLGKLVQKGLWDGFLVQLNARSLDGCAGLRAARKLRGEHMLLADVQIWLQRVSKQREAMVLGAVLAALIFVALRTVLRLCNLHIRSSAEMLL